MPAQQLHCVQPVAPVDYELDTNLSIPVRVDLVAQPVLLDIVGKLAQLVIRQERQQVGRGVYGDSFSPRFLYRHDATTATRPYSSGAYPSGAM